MAEAVYTDRGRHVETRIGGVQSDAFGHVRTAAFAPTCGWTFAYNINPAMVRTSVDAGDSGSVTHVTNEAVLSTGTAADGFAQVRTVKGTRYIPGVGGLARFTARFSPPKSNSLQLIGIIDAFDGWAFGYDGLEFGVLRRAAGVDHWTPQAEWNARQAAWLDPTRGNVYQIAYQWLGYGAQTFSIEAPTGELNPVHVIHYANSSTATSVDNPNLPLTARVENAGNATELTLATPSGVAGLDGDPFNDAISTILSVDAVRSVASGAGQPVLSLRNPETWEGKPNHLFVQALRLSFATDGAKPVLFRIYGDAVLTGGTYSAVLTGVSPIELNTTFTGFTGGVPVGAYAIGKSDNSVIDLTGSAFKGYPGQEFTIIADTTSISDIVAAVGFRQYL